MTNEEAKNIIDASDYFWLRPTDEEKEALGIASEHLASKTMEWIPVKLVELTEEEKAKIMLEGTGVVYDDLDYRYACPLPDDGDSVLISTDYGVRLADFVNDGDWCGFDGYDAQEVYAWMPLPNVFKVG